MSAESRNVHSGHNVFPRPESNAESRDLRSQPGNESESNGPGPSRSLITSAQNGVITPKEFKHLVTSQFEYPPLLQGASGMSDSLVAAFNPYGAKGRAIRYLAARIKLETAAEQGLCFSVAGAHKNCGTTYIAANLAVAFSEFGLRTLLIDANISRPRMQELFACSQVPGLSTRLTGGVSPTAFVVRLKEFRNLSLLPAGKSSVWRSKLLRRDFLAFLMSEVRDKYDVVVCDSPAMSTTTDDCEVIAAVCRNVLSVLRKDHTRVSNARAMLSALDAVGTRKLGSVLCEF